MKKTFIFIIFIACCFNLQGQLTEKAEEFYKEACNFMDTQNYDAAAADFENAINLDPDYFYIINENKFFEKLLKINTQVSSQKIKTICESLLKGKKNEDFIVYYFLGWAEFNLGEKDESRRNLELSKSIMKKDGVTFDMADELLKKINQ